MLLLKCIAIQSQNEMMKIHLQSITISYYLWSRKWVKGYIGEINIFGFRDVSWWHGLLHQGQFLLSEVLQPHTWCSRKSFEDGVDSLMRLQNEHIVLVDSGDTGRPQISHVFISPILCRYYW